MAEITTAARGLAADVPVDHDRLGLDQEAAVNCDGLHMVPLSMLTERIGAAAGATMDRVCAVVSFALGC